MLSVYQLKYKINGAKQKIYKENIETLQFTHERISNNISNTLRPSVLEITKVCNAKLSVFMQSVTW